MERTILVLLLFLSIFFLEKLFTIEKYVDCIQRMGNGNYGCNLVLFPSSISFRRHSIIESLLNDSLASSHASFFSPLMLCLLENVKMISLFVRSFSYFLFVCSFFFVVDDDVTTTPALT